MRQRNFVMLSPAVCRCTCCVGDPPPWFALHLPVGVDPVPGIVQHQRHGLAVGRAVGGRQVQVVGPGDRALELVSHRHVEP